MNSFSPELFVLSRQVALLVVVASALAFIIGWLLRGGGRSLPAPVKASLPDRMLDTPATSDELIQAKALVEELGRNLAATENQCVEALEQRDEAERQTLQRAAEARKWKAELEVLQNLETVPLQEHQAAVDEAVRQASLRAAEAEKLKAELEELKSREVVPLDEHQGLVRQLESLSEKTQQTAASDGELERQIAELKKAIEALEQGRAEECRNFESLREQIQAQANAHEGALRELKQQLATAEDFASRRQDQLQQLAREKAEAESALKTRIAELEARPIAPLEQPVPVRPRVQLPRPPLPPAEVLAEPVDETFTSFPPAPEASHRKPLRDSLFDEASVTSFSPEVPSLDDARATLAGLVQELQEKDQLVEVLTAEHARRQEDLESVRHSPPEEQQHKLRQAEKAEHSAQTKLAAANVERDRCRRQVRALKRSLVLAQGHTSQADDLTRIKGIKGGISQQLHAAGIFTYRQIVEWDAQDMQAFSELLAFKNRLHRDNWQEQA
ncbi:MAG: hypothetical protein JWO89_1124, partial [Verrucomicrobiaceae bacterium]|nr:hypothetical protein [Verrucomicrobiaceae bacterium]